MQAHTWELRAEAPDELREALLGADPASVLDAKFAALLAYADKLTRSPASCCRADVDDLRRVGATDAEISATVQVAAYFNYINRVADALGVDFEPEMTGGDDPTADP